MSLRIKISNWHRYICKNQNVPSYLKLPMLLASSWAFQGILYMDKSEKLFKILVDCIIFILMFLLMNPYLSILWTIVVSFLIAHTINWFVNGQIPVVLKNVNLTDNTQSDFEKYMIELSERIINNHSIIASAYFGSISRGELNISSDIDVRIVRKPGFLNAWHSIIFIVKERSKALLNVFPLDIYLLDDIENILKMGEEPVIISDSTGILREYYE